MPAEDDLKLIRQVLTARSIPAAPETFENEDTSALFNDLCAIRETLLRFSRGDFDTDVTGRNVLAAMLKSLQANLRHLTWQVQSVANGDFSQQVDFMGEFSIAFNSMTKQLEQNLIDLNEREVRLLTLLAELKASEERWNFAVQCSRDGIWDIDLHKRTVWYSDNFLEMMHYERRDLPDDLHWETKIYPDDLQSTEVLTNMLHGNDDLQSFSIDCRLQTGLGEYLWTNLQGMPVQIQDTRRLIVVIADISLQKETEQTLALRALHDHLTGLPNRYLLNDRIDYLAANTARNGTPFVYITLDLDYFKGVNDTYGHAAGDLVLVELAKRLSIGLRHTDTASRLGGDEFAAIYPCDPGMERATAETVMKRFYDNLKPPVMLGDVEFQLCSSVGVAFFPEHAQDLPTLFERADAALYKAKKRGKNQYAIYDPSDEPVQE